LNDAEVRDVFATILQTLEVKEHEIALMFCDIVIHLHIVVKEVVSSSFLFGL
jgi:hypothetical protein